MQQSCTAIGNRGNSQAHKANSLDEDGRADEQKANRIRIRLDTLKEFGKKFKAPMLFHSAWKLFGTSIV